MAVLNKTQVDELFKRESVLLGQADCVPGFRVAHLFGRDAVAHAKKIDGGWNAYGIGDFTLFYLLILKQFNNGAAISSAASSAMAVPT